MDQLWQQLWTTVGGGLAFITVALFLKWKKPQWIWLRAAVMLCGGVVAVRLVAMVLGTAVANKDDKGWVQQGLQWLGDQAVGIPTVGTMIKTVLDWLAIGLPWIVALLLLVWLIHDMFPRLWALRRGSGGAWGARGEPGDRGGIGRPGMAVARKSSVHEAEPHTMWVALVVPAAVVLVPPLAAAFKIGA